MGEIKGDVKGHSHSHLSSRSPSWLPEFLSGTYFSPCRAHAAAHKSERNFFCIKCRGDSLCTLCVQKYHPPGASHEILQVRRSSYHDVVRVNELSRLVDVSGIQIYVINSAKIVFLNGRPQSRPVKGAPYSCETCHRTLLDSNRYCSIGCKLKALRRDPFITLRPKGVAPQGVSKASPLADYAAAEAEMRARGPGGRTGAAGPRYGDAFSDDDSDTSSQRRDTWQKRALPSLVTDHEASSSLSGGGRFDEGEVSESFPRTRRDGERAEADRKRQRVADLECPALLGAVSPALAPGTPVQGFPIDGGSIMMMGRHEQRAPWRTHRRKGIPHRSPLG